MLFLLLPMLVGVVPVGAAPPTRASLPSVPPAPWQTVAKLNRSELPATSCPSVAVCWAIGNGDLLASSDGGATWTPRTELVPLAVDVLDALDCPTSELCLVTARLDDYSAAVIALRPAGVTMTRVAGASWMRTISCASATRCVATDGTSVFVTIDGGATWSTRPRPLPTGVANLTCVTGTSTCVGVGSSAGSALIARSDNFGASWRLQTPPSAVTALFGLDCPSVDVCVAAGYYSFGVAAVATTDAGATWVRQSLGDVSGQLRSVSCPSTTACWALGAYYSTPIAFATDDGGATWTRQSLPTFTGQSPSVSCPSVTSCAAMGRGGIAFATTNAGQAWQPIGVDPGLGLVSQLSCPTRGWCVGTARDGAFRPVTLTSVDGGTTWSRHAMPSATGYVTGLDCLTARSCHAWAMVSVPNTGRLRGQSLATTDGGLTWRLHRGDDVGPLGFAALGCSDSSHCMAVGSGNGRRGPIVLATSDGEQSWQAPSPPAGATALRAVACTTASCVVVGRTGGVGSFADVAWVTADQGLTYQPHPLPTVEFGYGSADCAGQTCVIAGNDTDWAGAIAVSSDGGATWSPSTLPADVTRLQDVGCGRPGVCVVASSNGSQSGDGGQLVGTVDGGQTWDVIDIPPTTASWPQAVACTPYRRACLASDYGTNGVPRVVAGDA